MFAGVSGGTGQQQNQVELQGTNFDEQLKYKYSYSDVYS